MKTRVVNITHPFGRTAGAAAILLLASTVPAQNIVAGNNLFVANWYSPGAIYQFTPGGAQTTFYSGGLGEPEGLAFDSGGNLFVADSSVGSVYEITPRGVKTTFASGLGSGDINALAFDRSGNLFVSGFFNGTIYKLTPGGAQSTFASGLNQPDALAFDASGNLFAADASGNIYAYTPGGARSIFASGVVAPFGMAFDAAGNLFVDYGGTGLGNGGILKITPGGVKTNCATGLYDPNYLAFDTAGNLFVADDGSGSVIEFSTEGTKSTFASGLGNATGIAFQGLSLPVPEPSAIILTALGASALLFYRRSLPNRTSTSCSLETGGSGSLGRWSAPGLSK